MVVTCRKFANVADGIEAAHASDPRALLKALLSGIVKRIGHPPIAAS
jgi:hypothetical protein